MEFYLIHNVGAELAATAGSTAKIDFTSGSATNYAADFHRQGVMVASCGASDLYLKFVGRGSGITPTVTTTNWHVHVPSGQSAMIRATREVDVWIYGSTAFTAIEVG